MRTERDTRLACIAATSDPGQLVALTAGLAELLRRDGPWTESAAAHRAAADAAARLDDRLGRANALVDLATVERLTGEYSAAERAGQQALEIYRDLGDRLGEANALCSVGNAL